MFIEKKIIEMTIERKIVKMILKDAEKAGATSFKIEDEEGEEYMTNAEETANFHGEVEFWNAVALNDRGETLGWFAFIAGNGADVLSDYSDNDWSNKVVARANEFADSIIR